MANGKNSILVYRDWITIFNELNDDEAGRLIKHFFEYVNDLNPEPPDRLTGLLFKQIENTLKRDLKKWESKSQRNRENALIRWDKENANASERMRNNAKNADRENDSDTVNDSEIYKEEGHLRITWNDMNKLIDEFGEEKANDYINQVLNYRKNNKYKSLYLTALKWLKRDRKASEERKRTKSKLAI